MTNRKHSIFHFACRFVEHENSTDSLIISIQFHNSNINKQDIIQKHEKHKTTKLNMKLINILV